MAQRFPPPTKTNRDHWLQWAINGYIEGRTTVEEFEEAVEDALNGRYVTFEGKPHAVAVE